MVYDVPGTLTFSNKSKNSHDDYVFVIQHNLFLKYLLCVTGVRGRQLLVVEELVDGLIIISNSKNFNSKKFLPV